MYSNQVFYLLKMIMFSEQIDFLFINKKKFMKKLISFLFVVGLCFTFISTNAQTASAQEKSISGAWVSQDGKEFSMMNDGFFSAVSADSSGSWNQTHAGTYTIDNANTITLKVLYSSFPDHIGALNTVNIILRTQFLP